MMKIVIKIVKMMGYKKKYKNIEVIKMYKK
jgi:hypothetical protein